MVKVYNYLYNESGINEWKCERKECLKITLEVYDVSAYTGHREWLCTPCFTLLSARHTFWDQRTRPRSCPPKKKGDHK